MAILNQALVASPRNAEAWATKAAHFGALGYLESQVECLQRALDAGAPPASRISLGVAEFRRGRFENAVAAYREFRERGSPTASEAAIAFGNEANALAALGDHASVESLYRRAISLDPSGRAHYFNLANWLSEQRRTKDALEVLTDGVRLGNGTGEVLLLTEIAFLHAEEQRAGEALAAAERALAIASNDPRALYLKGRALVLLGRLDEALSEMERVLAVEPRNEDAIRAREMIRNALR